MSNNFNKENRYSIAPQRIVSNKQNQQMSNIKQSNINNNLGNPKDSKTRKSSTSNLNLYPRATTFASISKSMDPRPIKDPQFQNECIDKILKFLIKESYDKNISMKDLTSPQAKDFSSIFLFIVNKIRPDWNVVINKIEEDVVPILNELRYPGNIPRNYLIAVGAPNTWPHLLAVLYWLVELANYLNMEETKENDIIQFNDSMSPNDQEKLFERNFKEFLADGYKQFISKGDSFNAVEIFQTQTETFVKMNHSNSDKVQSEIITLNAQKEELIKNNPDSFLVRNKLDDMERENFQLKNYLSHLDKKLNEISQNLENKIKTYEQKCEKNKELNYNIEELEVTIKAQKVTYEDFEKLKHNKTTLEKQLQNLNSRKQELNDLIWNRSNNEEELLRNITEKTKNIKIISEKVYFNNNFDKDNLNSDLDLNQIVGNIKSQPLNSIEQNSIFSNINAKAHNEISQKLQEIKDREESLINLKSELLKLDDKINEFNDLIIQTDSNNEQENSLLTLEKEKYSSLQIQKNEELKKINENFQKTANMISEKDKEMEELKIKENNLQIEIQEKDVHVDQFIKELESEYCEVFREVERVKTENIKEIRKSYKNMHKVFENTKKELTERAGN